MEYQDFYDIAAYGSENWKGNFTPKEIACYAYDYQIEYDYSRRKGKPTRTMIELCKLCCEDMDYLNYPQYKESEITITQMEKIFHDILIEVI